MREDAGAGGVVPLITWREVGVEGCGLGAWRRIITTIRKQTC